MGTGTSPCPAPSRAGCKHQVPYRHQVTYRRQLKRRFSVFFYGQRQSLLHWRVFAGSAGAAGRDRGMEAAGMRGIRLRGSL